MMNLKKGLEHALIASYADLPPFSAKPAFPESMYYIALRMSLASSTNIHHLVSRLIKAWLPATELGEGNELRESERSLAP